MAEYAGMHEESPGDVFTEIGSWYGEAGITVFARDTYTDVTISERVDPNDEDYDAAYWRAVKSCLNMLASISGPGAKQPEVTVTVDMPNQQAVTHNADGTTSTSPLAPEFIEWMSKSD